MPTTRIILLYGQGNAQEHDWRDALRVLENVTYSGRAFTFPRAVRSFTRAQWWQGPTMHKRQAAIRNSGLCEEIHEIQNSEWDGLGAGFAWRVDGRRIADVSWRAAAAPPEGVGSLRLESPSREILYPLKSPTSLE